MKTWKRGPMVWLGIALLLVSGALAQEGQAPARDGADASFEEMVEQIKKGELEDSVENIRKLRFAYEGAGDSYEVLRGMYRALAEFDFETSAELCEAILESNFVSIDGHFGCGAAYRNLGEVEKAQFHEGMGNVLMISIVSGRGAQKPWNAWVVISEGEEHAVLRTMGYEFQNKIEWRDEEGHYFDIVTAATPEGEIVTKYFNLDHQFGRLEKLLERLQKTEE